MSKSRMASSSSSSSLTVNTSTARSTMTTSDLSGSQRYPSLRDFEDKLILVNKEPDTVGAYFNYLYVMGRNESDVPPYFFTDVREQDFLLWSGNKADCPVDAAILLEFEGSPKPRLTNGWTRSGRCSFRYFSYEGKPCFRQTRVDSTDGKSTELKKETKGWTIVHYYREKSKGDQSPKGKRSRKATEEQDTFDIQTSEKVTPPGDSIVYKGNHQFLGTVTAGRFLRISDSKMKQDIEEYAINLALESDPMTIRPVLYHLLGGVNEPLSGVLAEEVQETHPFLVHKLDDGTLTVDYDGFHAIHFSRQQTLLHQLKQPSERVQRIEEREKTRAT